MLVEMRETGRDNDAPWEGARKTLTLVSTTGALAICVCEVELSSVAKSKGFQALPLLRAACFCFSDGNWVERAALASSMRFFWRSSFAAASDRVCSLLSERVEAMARSEWLLPRLEDLSVAVSESKELRAPCRVASLGFSVRDVVWWLRSGLVSCEKDGVPSGRRLATEELAASPS